ncbi:putative ribonuclease H protein [Citrus sinensis]|uniref:Ribonuclease H protein n=1 Tax=Citrus sinensis TaxID=2711 RepID=A0ACB8HVS2_CITSI|nr:putative ribonuclease H protein [Citrus sinensis]
MALILRLMQLLCLQNMAHICGRLLVLHGLRWNVGNGTRIRFWQDAWVADVGPLVHLAMAPIPEAILHDWDKEVRWKSIWKWRGPHRIRTFLWLAAKERIKCKAELYRRDIGVDTICMRCGCAVEDTVHALRNCVASWRIWNMLLAGRKVVNEDSMVQDIRVRAEEIIRTFDTFQSDRRLRIQNMFGWLPPRWPYYKLNSDGARKRSSFAGADGLIRDATGRWHDGFCMNIRICYVTIAELWGLYQGLVLAWVSVHHIYCEANFAADFLASHALTLPLGLHLPRASRLGYIMIV